MAVVVLCVLAVVAEEVPRAWLGAGAGALERRAGWLEPPQAVSARTATAAARILTSL